MEEKENHTGPVPKGGDSPSSAIKSCALCGCSTPAVRCDRCSSQIFCLSCDDVYHRHPKRRLHLRKAVDSIWNSSRSPRLRRRTDLPGDPSKIPIPPPRTKKRERHTIGGRMFFNSNLELGSFAHSKMFDLKSFSPVTKEFTGGHKSPGTLEPNYENDANIQAMRNSTVSGRNEIYENDNIANNQDKIIDNSSDMERSPWNVSRPNISSPIQVSIPSSSPDMMTNGQSFGFPGKPQSHSVADLPGAASNQVGPHPYHFPHNYPYMHPPIHPPYSHSMAHLNCAQCLSSSWSNLMSPHPSPYFHPMPWGSAQSTLTRGHPTPGPHGHIKHSHGDLASYTDSNFHYPYPGGTFYPNVPPIVDPNFIKDLHQQAEMQRMRKSPTNSRQEQSNEDMNTVAEHDTDENRMVDGSVTETASQQEVQAEDAEPKVPEKPTKPWSCVHCTFINPPGIYICQVCCKTSYGTKTSESQEISEVLPVDNRDSESPMQLVNRDAEASSEFSEYREAQKVI